MKGILLLNGQPYPGEINAEKAYVVCCDGAYNWARGKVRIDCNLGDFDSVAKDVEILPPPSEVYPSEKDYTDGEIGLRALLSRGCKEIEIYGAGGGREDHFLANLHLLYYAYFRGVKGKIITEHAEIFIATGETKLVGDKGRTVSLLPFGCAAHIMDGEGFKYRLEDKTLDYGRAGLGVSNVVTQDYARFCCDRGVVLVFVNQKKE